MFASATGGMLALKSAGWVNSFAQGAVSLLVLATARSAVTLFVMVMAVLGVTEKHIPAKWFHVMAGSLAL
jgi:hypothetical protein